MAHVEPTIPYLRACDKEICRKVFPKPLIHVTQQGDDAYPKYRRRSTEQGGEVCIMKTRVSGRWTEQHVDNRWVVQLAIHLENGQRVYFTTNTAM